MNIKVAAFTVSEKSSNTSDHHLKFNFLNTALKKLGPFLFDMLIPGIHMEQGLHNKIIKKYTP